MQVSEANSLLIPMTKLLPTAFPKTPCPCNSSARTPWTAQAEEKQKPESTVRHQWKASIHTASLLCLMQAVASPSDATTLLLTEVHACPA